MNIERANIEELVARLTIQMTPEDYRERVEKVLGQYQRQVQMPGFRKGKVPMPLIRRQYGTPVLAEEINKMIQEQLEDYLKSNQLNILGNPIPSEDAKDEGNWEKPENFTFHFDIGLAPDIHLEAAGQRTFTRYRVQPTEESIEQRINGLAMQEGTFQPTEVAGENDVVTAWSRSVDEQGEAVSEAEPLEVKIFLRNLSDETLRAAFLGVKDGDHRKVDAHAISHQGHEELGRILGLSHDEVHNIEGVLAFEVIRVERLVPAAIDNALWDKLYGEGTITSEAAFRERVAQDLAKSLEREEEALFRRAFVAELIDHLQIPLPDEFMKRWIKLTNDKPITEEQLEAEYPIYAKDVRWDLLKRMILDEINEPLKMEDLMAEGKKLLLQQYSYLGLTGAEEWIDSTVESLLQKQEERERIIELLVDRRVVEALCKRFSIVDQTLPMPEFQERYIAAHRSN